ncbi:hypothetical protein D3C72_2274500 [compost metagenome]
MGVARVFDCQRVQAELFLQLQQHAVGRLVQAHPDEAVATVDDIADRIQADVVALALVIVVHAVDDAGRIDRGHIVFHG